MVSLNDDSSRQGGFFFDGPSMSQDSEELLREEALLSQENRPAFRRIHTTWAIILEIITVVALVVSVFIVPLVAQDCGGAQSFPAFYMLTLFHSGFWFVVLLFDQYFRYEQNASRMHGYLEFHKKTRLIRRIPFYIFSAGNAFLVFMMTMVSHYCHDGHPCDGVVKLTRLHYLQIIVSLESALVIIGLLVYLVRTIKFNRESPAPDVTQEDLIASFSQSQPPDIGFRRNRDESYMDEILERQADLIRYLKQHNSALGRRIVQLRAQLDNQQ